MTGYHLTTQQEKDNLEWRKIKGGSRQVNGEEGKPRTCAVVNRISLRALGLIPLGTTERLACTEWFHQGVSEYVDIYPLSLAPTGWEENQHLSLAEQSAILGRECPQVERGRKASVGRETVCRWPPACSWEDTGSNARHLSSSISFNRYKSPTRWLSPSSPFHRWGNWGSKWLGILLKIP